MVRKATIVVDRKGDEFRVINCECRKPITFGTAGIGEISETKTLKLKDERDTPLITVSSKERNEVHCSSERFDMKTKIIIHVLTHGDEEAANKIFELQDGYGQRGFTHYIGRDPVAIERSSPKSIKDMYAYCMATDLGRKVFDMLDDAWSGTIIEDF